MIVLKQNEIETTEYNGHYIVHIIGEFYSLTPQEFRLLTFTPQNILLSNNVDIKFDNFYYNAKMHYEYKHYYKSVPFLYKTEYKEHVIYINSYNTNMNLY